MKTKVFSIFDVKAECFGTPFFSPNRALAQRSFNDLANDERSTVHKHRADFMMYEIGEFDDETGELKWIKPVSVGHAVLNGDAVEKKLVGNGIEEVVQ